MAKPITIKITGDTSGLKNALSDAEGKVARFGKGTVAKFGALAAAAGGALAAVGVAKFGADAIGAASDMEESLAKIGVVFGEQSAAVEEWASNSAEAFGQSKQQALEAAGTYGNLFRAFGVGQEETQKMSTSLVELAADLASFNNTSVDDALLALRSGLSGETEPLKRFGIAMTDVRLREEALRLGLIKTTKDALTPGAKAQAAYALIMKDSALAQGDFARTSDGLANKQRIMSAKWKDLQAAIGKAFLPVVLKVVSVVTDKVLPVLQEWGQEVGPLVEALGKRLGPVIQRVGKFLQGLVPYVRTAVEWIGSLFGSLKSGEQSTSTSVGKVAGILRGFAQMWASTFAAIRATVERVVAIVSWVWENFGDRIWKVVSAMLRLVVDALRDAFQVVRGLFDVIAAVMTGKWGKAWDALKRTLGAALTLIMNLVRNWQEYLGKVFDLLRAVAIRIFANLWDKVKELAAAGANAVVDFIRALPGRLLAFVGAVGAAGLRLGAAILEKIGEGIAALPGKIGDWLGAGLSALGDLVQRFASAGLALGAAILNGIGDGLRSVVDFAASIGEAVQDAIIGAVNWVIDRLNDAIPNSLGWGPARIDIDDDPIPTIGRAMGGPAQGMVRVGERGPETVVLPRGSRVIPNHADRGGSGPVSVYVTSTADPAAIGREVAWAMRTSGV